LTGSKIRLRPKRFQDAEKDYNWRKDSELARLDAAIPITCSFEEYQRFYNEEPLYPTQIYHFAIETKDGKHIGNCSFFSIDEIKQDAEFGIMIGDRAYWDKGYGTDAISTVIESIFSQTPLKRIHLKTLDWNTRAHRCFEKCGFTRCGNVKRGAYSFLLMEIYHPDKQPKLGKD